MNNIYSIAHVYPITYWLTAIFGGLSTVTGFFALIYGLFIFTRKPTVKSFFAGVVSVCSYLFFSLFWYILALNGGGDGHAKEVYSFGTFDAVQPDLTPYYWYWGLSALACVVWGFWGFLKAFYEGQD